ncbi:MAG: rane protein of unknown function [Gammaproteobacteria bacterium]|jgi:hypothetical protein|nr:rane protein of unknown function [Gammaproteobacteria bacterium]
MFTPLHHLKQRITHSLWEADPGYLHLRQGTRTLLASIITLLVCSWPGLYTRVLAGFAAGLVCQGISGINITAQKKTFTIATTALLAYFSLISYVSPYPLVIAIVIICASFSVFALRALGPRYALFPLFVWIMGFMTSLFPSATGTDFIMRLGCIALGCGISFLVYFYLLPPRPLSYFFENIRYFIILVHTRSLTLERQLHQPNPFKGKEKYSLTLRYSLRKYYLHNQTILASFEVADFTRKNLFLSLLASHYLAGKALLMLQDNLITLARGILIEDDQIKIALCQSLKELSAFTQNIDVRASSLKVILKDRTLTCLKSVSTLKELLEKSTLNTVDLVPLYQFINSLNELCDCLCAFAQEPILEAEEASYAQ